MTTAQVSTDIESIQSCIKQALMHRDGIVKSEEGTMRSVQAILGISCSGVKFDSAISKLIKNREVIWHRPDPFEWESEKRPVTIRLAQYACGMNYYRGSFAR